MAGDGVILVSGAAAYVDGEGAGNGDDTGTLDNAVGEGPSYETREEKFGFEGKVDPRGDESPVGTCAELTVEVAGRG